MMPLPFHSWRDLLNTALVLAVKAGISRTDLHAAVDDTYDDMTPTPATRKDEGMSETVYAVTSHNNLHAIFHDESVAERFKDRVNAITENAYDHAEVEAFVVDECCDAAMADDWGWIVHFNEDGSVLRTHQLLLHGPSVYDRNFNRPPVLMSCTVQAPDESTAIERCREMVANQERVDAA